MQDHVVQVVNETSMHTTKFVPENISGMAIRNDRIGPEAQLIWFGCIVRPQES